MYAVFHSKCQCCGKALTARTEEFPYDEGSLTPRNILDAAAATIRFCDACNEPEHSRGSSEAKAKHRQDSKKGRR